MKRVTEPELMCSPLQVNAYADADFSETDKEIIRNLNLLLKEAEKKIDEHTLIVDLGCGPGNISERIALQWPYAKTIGIDGSLEMLELAKRRGNQLCENYGVKRLSFLHSDLSVLAGELLPLDDLADVVVSNSLLHHIHNPKTFWNSIKTISAKGSLQFHRDLRRPGSPEEVLAMQKEYLPNAPEVLKTDYIASLHAAFTVEEIRKQLEIEGLSRLKVFEVEERYLDIVGIF